jgi:3-hydroxyisobutyrate dehydrogenase-like beta-hydroxyacid dehydrogenase
MKPTIGVIGLGIMGGAMAIALVEAGYRVVGYDIAPAPRQRLRRARGRALASSTAVAQRADVVITSLASVAALDDAMQQIVAAKRGKRATPLTVIEMSTLPVADKERFAAALARVGAAVVDCPISGTAVRLKERTWQLLVSGKPADCERVEPILRVFTDHKPYVGAFGHGTKMKFLANHLVAIYNVAYGELMMFARKMGLSTRRVHKLFGWSPALGTGVLKLRGGMMVERRYTPPTMKIEVWQKDMQVIGDMAKLIGAPTPLFTACAPIYTAAMGQGLAKSDTAAVCEVLERMAGIAPKRRARSRAVPSR